MYSLLIAVIYAAFISLGLPDALLGSAWPVMHQELGAPVAFAGVLSMIISACTVLSSLLSDWCTRKLGTGLLTSLSVLLSALSLLGFSFAPNFWVMCLLGIPYGLAAGAVDAAMNNYVALHYSSRHMSWLHCFWGVGAVISPYIMGSCLTGGAGWRSGYWVVSGLQLLLALMMFASLPLWKKPVPEHTGSGEEANPRGVFGVLRIPGVLSLLLGFFAYCAMEWTACLWTTTFLVEHRGIEENTAAFFGSLIFIGITLGRFLNGFIADRLGDKKLIRLGTCILIFGLVLLLLPWDLPCLAGVLILGFGCAPIYPSFIHSTPEKFGRENSQAIIGVQMAFAYVGSTFAPPVFGWLSQYFSLGLFPFFLLAFALIMLLLCERLNRMEGKTRR